MASPESWVYALSLTDVNPHSQPMRNTYGFCPAFTPPPDQEVSSASPFPPRPPWLLSVLQSTLRILTWPGKPGRLLLALSALSRTSHLGGSPLKRGLSWQMALYFNGLGWIFFSFTVLEVPTQTTVLFLTFSVMFNKLPVMFNTLF